MREREKLIKEIETWEGLNKYIVRKAKKELDALESLTQTEGLYEASKVEPVEPEEPIMLKEEPKKLSRSELLKLNKKEQVDMLKKLKAKKIPRFEKDRVNMILLLQ